MNISSKNIEIFSYSRFWDALQFLIIALSCSFVEVVLFRSLNSSFHDLKFIDLMFIAIGCVNLGTILFSFYYFFYFLLAKVIFNVNFIEESFSIFFFRRVKKVPLFAIKKYTIYRNRSVTYRLLILTKSGKKQSFLYTLNSNSELFNQIMQQKYNIIESSLKEFNS